MSSLNLQISQLFKTACIAELEALKPGNVHIFADGHGMTIHDFIKSADAVSKVIAQPDLSLGQRILVSVEATQKAVGCNTNLGIILLCAPLIQAVLTVTKGNLQQRLQQVLQQTIISDAQYTFDAIALANPAGLGDAAQHDVHQAADCTLLQAMQIASERDLIAMQYTNGFETIFNLSLPILAQENIKNNAALNDSWLTTKLYLTLLSTYADSHIMRKHGAKIATEIQQQANQHLTIFNLSDNPKLYQSKLLAWDNQLKQAHINPGTSADLTVASLFAQAINKLIQFDG
ncbi:MULTISPECIES: triphosphoribosyl-dephospho-CoA synthase [Methylotenera]|uniref:triphosphoribosyl-dephospho-CoA synthase n=1 Tax=Methylotenera TaxID=359407 RepID=UPI0003719714|nr:MULTISPECIES: triphosphoribosyl-dephospho-CoA synthase [Methylotenera]